MEYLTDFARALRDRVSNRFTGAFFFSGVIWNWPALTALFAGSETFLARIQFVNDFYANIWTKVGRLIAGPFLTAAALEATLPVASTIAFIWRERWNRKQRLERAESNRLVADIEKFGAYQGQIISSFHQRLRHISGITGNIETITRSVGAEFALHLKNLNNDALNKEGLINLVGALDQLAFKIIDALDITLRQDLQEGVRNSMVAAREEARRFRADLSTLRGQISALRPSEIGALTRIADAITSIHGLSEKAHLEAKNDEAELARLGFPIDSKEIPVDEIKAIEQKSQQAREIPGLKILVSQLQRRVRRRKIR